MKSNKASIYLTFIFMTLMYLAVISKQFSVDFPPLILISFIISLVFFVLVIYISLLEIKKNNKKKTGYFLLFLSNLGLIGMVFNLLAVVFNGFSMPVFVEGGDENYQFETPHHIVTSAENVNFFFFVDRYDLGWSIASYGDFFAIVSVIGLLILLLINTIIWKKKRKKTG